MNDLLKVLDSLRSAMLAGQLEGIAAMAAEIERLLPSSGDLSAEQRAAIAASARRNVAVLGAALQGMRAARRRLAELREASTGHRTYGPSGQRSTVGQSASTLRQRV